MFSNTQRSLSRLRVTLHVTSAFVHKLMSIYVHKPPPDTAHGPGLRPTRSAARNFFERVGKTYLVWKAGGGGGSSKGLNQKNRPRVVFNFLGPPWFFYIICGGGILLIKSREALIVWSARGIEVARQIVCLNLSIVDLANGDWRMNEMVRLKPWVVTRMLGAMG